MTECDKQLKQLQQKLEIAQETLKSCEELLQESKENLQESEEELRECLDVMNNCGQILEVCELELRRSVHVLKEFKQKLTDRLSISEERIWFANYTSSVIPQFVLHLLGYSGDQLEQEEDVLRKCSNELEETERTLKKLTKDLKESVMELSKQKQHVRKPKDPQSTRQVRFIDYM